MRYKQLPHSTLEISQLALGTMTYGEQNTESDAFNQLDFAIEHGINFIDTAEMYPVPPNGSSQGRSEQYIGNWLKQSSKRDKVVLATKVSGPRRLPHIRDNTVLDRKNIHLAIDESLKRLQTDYVDLYQIHWPQRETNCFGQLNYSYPTEQEEITLIETLEALNELVKAGKVRYLGVSNDTPWGVMSLLRLAEKHSLPRIVSIQNPYNLLNRSFDVGLSEVSYHEGVELLAYSPLAFGCLTGKYLNNARPDNARCSLFSRFSRYFTPQGVKATEAYIQIAKKYDLDPAQMALAFVNQRPFVASNIIGATSIEQLQINIDSINIELTTEILEDIQEVSTLYSNPCP